MAKRPHAPADRIDCSKPQLAHCFYQTSCMNITIANDTIIVGDTELLVTRPHRFGIVIEPGAETCGDYLHDQLLASENREQFFDWIADVGLVVCKRVFTSASSYRKVRGKSSSSKLSQAEYYHHDGCSCPTKPRVVEIRLPHQEIERHVATAVAPFPDVIRAMILALPRHVPGDRQLVKICGLSADIVEPISLTRGSAAQDRGLQLRDLVAPERWDQIQGRVTRLVRRELDAESCRAYFREVDELAGAYDVAWEMGESRLILNNEYDLTRTMQHRRAHPGPRRPNEKNGSLVKRWPAEEI